MIVTIYNSILPEFIPLILSIWNLIIYSFCIIYLIYLLIR